MYMCIWLYSLLTKITREMPVFLRNFQTKILFNENLLKLQCGLLLNLLGAERFDLSVVCINKKEIQQLNQTYRKEDKPTDVLSFPYHENVIPGQLPAHLQADCDYNLGDIILGMPVISEACCSDGVRLEERLPVIVTHGLCHLIGYTHGNQHQWKQMYRKEVSLLRSLNNAFGTKLEPLTKSIHDTDTYNVIHK